MPLPGMQGRGGPDDPKWLKALLMQPKVRGAMEGWNRLPAYDASENKGTGFLLETLGYPKVEGLDIGEIIAAMAAGAVLPTPGKAVRGAKMGAKGIANLMKRGRPKDLVGEEGLDAAIAALGRTPGGAGAGRAVRLPDEAGLARPEGRLGGEGAAGAITEPSGWGSYPDVEKIATGSHSPIVWDPAAARRVTSPGTPVPIDDPRQLDLLRTPENVRMTPEEFAQLEADFAAQNAARPANTQAMDQLARATQSDVPAGEIAIGLPGTTGPRRAPSGYARGTGESLRRTMGKEASLLDNQYQRGLGESYDRVLREQPSEGISLEQLQDIEATLADEMSGAVVGTSRSRVNPRLGQAPEQAVDEAGRLATWSGKPQRPDVWSETLKPNQFLDLPGSRQNRYGGGSGPYDGFIHVDDIGVPDAEIRARPRGSEPGTRFDMDPVRADESIDKGMWEAYRQARDVDARSGLPGSMNRTEKMLERLSTGDPGGMTERLVGSLMDPDLPGFKRRAGEKFFARRGLNMGDVGVDPRSVGSAQTDARIRSLLGLSRRERFR